MNESPFENLKLELRRGCLVLAVLAQLRVEHYGYTLRKALADDGLEPLARIAVGIGSAIASMSLARTISEWIETSVSALGASNRPPGTVALF